MNKGILASGVGIGGTGLAVTGAYGLGMFESGEAQAYRPELSGEYKDWWI